MCIMAGKHESRQHAQRQEQEAERWALKVRQREGTGTVPVHPQGQSSSCRDAPSLQTVPLAGKHALKYGSLWGTFLTEIRTVPFVRKTGK